MTCQLPPRVSSALPASRLTRPLAAGMVSVRAAVGLLTVLCTVLVGGWFVVPKVLMVIGGYLLLNLAYTFVLKHEPVGIHNLRALAHREEV
mgnify:CR=1 FL=1